MLFMKGNISETISSVKKILLRLGRLYLENAKLTVAEKLTVVFSAATLLLIVLVLTIFALAFLSGAILERCESGRKGASGGLYIRRTDAMGGGVVLKELPDTEERFV